MPLRFVYHGRRFLRGAFVKTIGVAHEKRKIERSPLYTLSFSCTCDERVLCFVIDIPTIQSREKDADGDEEWETSAK